MPYFYPPIRPATQFTPHLSYPDKFYESYENLRSKYDDYGYEFVDNSYPNRYYNTPPYPEDRNGNPIYRIYVDNGSIRFYQLVKLRRSSGIHSKCYSEVKVC